jgi:hypothetical protein
MQQKSSSKSEARTRSSQRPLIFVAVGGRIRLCSVQGLAGFVEKDSSSNVNEDAKAV